MARSAKEKIDTLESSPQAPLGFWFFGEVFSLE